MKSVIDIILKEIAGVPSEFQVLPEGEIEICGKDPARLDEVSARDVIASFEARGNDMVIDYEHQTLSDVQAPAAGWISKLVWRGKDGLWAIVEWTKRAREYLENREYRYFSPVMQIRQSDRSVLRLINVALTNDPAINHLKPIVAKFTAINETQNDKEDNMIQKLRAALGLAAEAAEEKVVEAVQALVTKCKDLETRGTGVVACKEVLEALGAKEGAGKDEVVRIVASLKAPGDAAVALSQEVAALKTKIAAMEQDDLISLALKEGKTSPEELDKWGRDLAGKSPEQFRQIVLSRPAGSVIPVDGIRIAAKSAPGVVDESQRTINEMMGIDEETFKKYNK